MKKIACLSFIVLSVLMFTGCPREIITEEDSVLSGKLDNVPFEFAAGYVEDEGNGDYTVYLWGKEGKNINGISSDNKKIFPYISFTLSKGLVDSSYKVTTFGTGKNEISVTVHLPVTGFALNFILFDKGTLDVKMLSDDTVKLTFKNCITTDNNKTSLNGSCELKVLRNK